MSKIVSRARLFIYVAYRTESLEVRIPIIIEPRIQKRWVLGSFFRALAETTTATRRRSGGDFHLSRTPHVSHSNDIQLLGVYDNNVMAYVIISNKTCTVRRPAIDSVITFFNQSPVHVAIPILNLISRYTILCTIVCI